jgi:subfamily B ATP-binding cassette protein HlyB/CyaB
MTVHQTTTSDSKNSKFVDTALTCLAIIVKLLEISVGEEQLRRAFDVKEKPMDTTMLLRGAKYLGLKARLTKSNPEQFNSLHLPAIALLTNGNYIVVARNDGKKLIVFDPLHDRPLGVASDSFFKVWSGEVITIKRPFSLKRVGKQFNVSWFIPIILRYKHFFYEVLIASFFLQLFGLVTPLFTQVIIDKVLLHKGTATLDILALALLFAALFQTIMNILRTYLAAHTTNKVDMILGARLIHHLLTLPLRYFELRRVGDTLTRVAALNGIRDFLTGSTMTVFLDVFFSIIFILVMLYYSVQLTLIALIALPLYLLQNIIVTPLYRERLQDVWTSGAESNAFLVEAITGVHTVKSLALEPQFNHKWETLLAKYIRAAFNSSKFNIVVGNIGSLIQSLTGFAILFCGGHKVMNGEITIGQLIAFQMLAGQASAPIYRLTGIWQSCQQAALSMERLGDILNTPPEYFHGNNNEKSPSMAGNINFNHVNFRYHAEGQIILNQVTLEIQAGRRIGIVGRSGSGKSTLMKLMQRLYLPESGQVSIGGVDLAQVNPAWLRQKIGVVLQENFLFNGSVRENISVACPGAAIEEVVRAAKLAGAHDFILELPEGYDAKVGERGMALSGGQQQRIAIARAILTNPAILLFDEATSALDYESERIIMNNLDGIAAGRTMIMVAHRLSTVRGCDTIIVMEQGQVVEQGTHQELMMRKGLYYNLYNQQEV